MNFGRPFTIDGLSRTITDVLGTGQPEMGISETHIARAQAPSVLIRGAPTSLAAAHDYLTRYTPAAQR